MKLLVLNPSAVCHNRCAVCAMRGLYGNKTLDFRKVDGLLKEILRFPESRRFDEVLIGGGEPLLYPRLGEVLSTLEKGGITTVLFTSGCSETSKLKVLEENPPRRVTVSLDSADPTVHDRVRGRSGAFSDGIRTLRFVRDELPGCELSSMTVVTTETINGLRALVDLLSSERVTRASFQLVMDIGNVSMRGMRPVESDLEKFYFHDLPLLTEAARNSGLSLRMIPDFEDSPRHRMEKNHKDSSASAGSIVSDDSMRRETRLWSKGEYNVAVLRKTGFVCPLEGHVTINPDGSVFPCSQAAIYDPKWAVGNIMDEPLGKVLDSVEKNRVAADRRIETVCTRCAARSNMLEEIPRIESDVPHPSPVFTLLTENHLFAPFGAYLPPSLPGLGGGLLAGGLKKSGIPFELVDMYPHYIESACNRDTWVKFMEQEAGPDCPAPTLRDIGAHAGSDGLLSYFKGVKRGLADVRSIVSADRLLLTARLLKEYSAWNRNEIFSGRGGSLPLIQSLLQKVKTRWVGISVTDPREPVAGQVVSSLSEAGHQTVIGGQSTFFLHSEPVRTAFAKLSSSGWIVRGYGEEVLPMLVERLALWGNPGELEQVVSTEDLSSSDLGFSTCGRPGRSVRPDFSFHDFSGYMAPLSLLPVGTTRGCYWKRCAFCRHAVKRGETVSVPLQSVVSSMIHHRKTMGVRYFSINDESLHPETGLELAEMILREPLLEGVRFAAAARPEKGFSREVLQKMAKAGLSTVYWGVESAHPEVLNRMQKGTHPETVGTVLENAARAGISNLAFYMFGFPGENAAHARATISFMKATRGFVDGVRVNKFVLQDGTPVFESPNFFGIRNIRPDPRQPGLYSFDDPDGHPPGDLERFLKAARSPGLVSGRLVTLAGGGDGEEFLPLYFLQRCLEIEKVSFEKLSCEASKYREKGLISRGILTSTSPARIGTNTVLKEGEAVLPVGRDDIVMLKAMDGTRTLKELKKEFTGSLVDALLEKMCSMELLCVCKGESTS